YNYKYSSTPIVAIREANKKRYRPTDFDKDYEQVETYQPVDIPLPQTTGEIDGLELLEKNRLKMSPTVWRLYQEELPEGQRSEALWKLVMYLFEAGFDREQVLAIVKDAACNKWGDNLKGLWKDVCRAEVQHVRNTDALKAGKLNPQE